MAADDAAVCPVDHKARAAWLEKAQAASAQGQPPPPHPLPPAAPAAPAAPGCDSATLDQSLPAKTAGQSILGYLGLRQEREVSSIPRAVPGEQGTAATDAGRKSNGGEGEARRDEATGNWVYPSEEMFFNAMKRKKFDPRVEDMRSIVPIHNAVNERAWREIKAWEQGRGAESGRDEGKAGKSLNFYLDVRPKLNSWEGVKTRVSRYWGF
ncbi:Cytochrome c1 heme lyase [Neofusicoccum ribis]|uniref:Holocytochrome c-type synthase n=1 Tax=Neofusicoccum ribis TaxID=45134 RepID=A0ABR3SU82_9PEZI